MIPIWTELLGLSPSSPDAAIFTSNSSKTTPSAPTTTNSQTTTPQSQNASHGSMVQPSSTVTYVMVMALAIVLVAVPTETVSIYTWCGIMHCWRQLGLSFCFLLLLCHRTSQLWINELVCICGLWWFLEFWDLAVMFGFIVDLFLFCFPQLMLTDSWWKLRLDAKKYS